MPRKRICSDEQIIEELKKGIAEATVGKICHCHPRRVRKIKEERETITGEKIVLKDKRYLRKEKPSYPLNPVLGRELRSHKEAWIDYMQNNPYYFQEMFDLDPTDRNIMMVVQEDEIISMCLGM